MVRKRLVTMAGQEAAANGLAAVPQGDCDPLHAVEDMVRIAGAQREKRRLQKIWLDKRSEAMTAKRLYEAAGDELSRLIEAAAKPSPLFDGVPDSGVSEEAESVTLGDLGIPHSVVLALAGAGISTIGDYYACSHYGVLARLPGLNPEKAALVTEAVASYIARMATGGGHL